MAKTKPKNKRKSTTSTAKAASSLRKTPVKKNKGSLRKYTLHYILLFTFLFATLVVLSRTVLFKIEKIDVAGNNKYSDAKIIEVSKLKKDENMFSADTSKAEKEILKAFPYINNATFKKRLPHRMTIQVEMIDAMGAILLDDGYAIITKEGKVVEKGVADAPRDVMVVKGIANMDLKVGETYPPDEVEEFTMLEYFIEAQKLAKLDKIVYLNLSDVYDLKALYDNRILISFGTEDDLEYKMKKAQEMVLSKDEYATFEGIIDVSLKNEARVKKKSIDDILIEDLGEAPVVDDSPYDIVYLETTIAKSVEKSNTIAQANTILDEQLEEYKEKILPKSSDGDETGDAGEKLDENTGDNPAEN